MAERVATITEIRALSPALSATVPGSPYPTELLEAWSDVAALFIGLATWGELASHGHACLTAHFAARAAAGAFGPAGPMTGSTVEGKSRSWASALRDDALATTSFGEVFLSLKALVVARRGTTLVLNEYVDNGV